MTNQLREVVADALPEPVAVVGPVWMLAWVGSGPIAPIVRSHGMKIGDGLYTASQMIAFRDAALATLPTQSAGVEFVDVDAEIARIEASDGGRGKMAVARTWAKEALQNVSPAGVEERARELLAAEYESDGRVLTAKCIRGGHSLPRDQERAIRAIAAALRTPASEGDGGRVVAWIRFCSDGLYEGPIHDSQLGDIRRNSGAWTPLYPPTQQEARP